ncbi:MAG: hypothetical protein K2Z80_30195 [Xanthobacteraceae bacterium]|nr:hypothetical protein [Xanthobacteraceae bacterium]
MADLQEDIAAFDAMRRDLETRHNGKWVLFHNRVLIGVYETFDQAANEAVKRFGRGPYLIRQIGASQASLPASVLCHRPVHAGR